jgi:hypothetical protein
MRDTTLRQRKAGWRFPFPITQAHPRQFIRLCAGTITISFVWYMVVILYPAYASGIASVVDFDQLDSMVFTVPFYSTGSHTVDYGQPIWTLAFLAAVFMVGVAPPLTISMLIVLGSQWRRFTAHERSLWIVTLGVIWSTVVVTFSAASRLLYWLVD